MSAVLYDEALLNKIKGWVKDGKMKITGPNETRQLFQYIADTTNDKPIELPLIALRRDYRMEILNKNKRPMTFDGWRKDADYKDPHDPSKGAAINQLNAIPIRLFYQLDIFTRLYEEAEEYVRNFVFNLINFPKICITIPYNSANIIQEAYIDLSPEISDNSDIPERLVTGQFTRKSITFSVDGWLFDYRTRDAVTIDGVSVEIYTEIKEEE